MVKVPRRGLILACSACLSGIVPSALGCLIAWIHPNEFEILVLSYLPVDIAVAFCLPFVLWGVDAMRWPAALGLGWLTLAKGLSGVTIVATLPGVGLGLLASALACVIGMFLLLLSQQVDDYVWSRHARASPGEWAKLQERAHAQCGPAPLDRGSSGMTARLLAEERRRRGWSRAVTIVLRIAFAGSSLYFALATADAVLGLVSASGILTEMAEGKLAFGEKVAFVLVQGSGGFVAGLLAITTLLKAYVSFFLFPFAATLPLSGPFAMTWKRPPRFLLLRPFRREQLTGALLRFLQRHVVGFGHTYTLADHAVRVRWYTRLPLVLGQVSLLSFRFRKIYHPAHVDRLCRAARRPRLRNLNWILSGAKVFPVACSDESWRASVSQLIREVDLIMIDVSELRSNVLWELSECERLGKLDRVILLTDGAGGDRDAWSGFTRLTYGSSDDTRNEHPTWTMAEILARVGRVPVAELPAVPPGLRDPLRWKALRRTGLLAALAGLCWLIYWLWVLMPTELPPPWKNGGRFGGIRFPLADSSRSSFTLGPVQEPHANRRALRRAWCSAPDPVGPSAFLSHATQNSALAARFAKIYAPRAWMLGSVHTTVRCQYPSGVEREFRWDDEGAIPAFSGLGRRSLNRLGS